MTFDEYRRYDALELAALVRNKDVQPAELLEVAINRAEAVNPSINAIIYPLYDLAKKMAGEVDTNSPFAGVPFLLKDLALHLKGYPLQNGCAGYKGYVSKEDSYVVERFRQAGFVFMGKTNLPELGLTPYTEPRAFGPTRNPWNTSRTAGGSSGGSAAAVAAGITPIATASDGGGSIRIPASCNGLFGLKPSRGLISLGPTIGEMWSGAVTEGCVSRSVRDTAAFLDAIIAETPGEPYLLRQPVRPFIEEMGADPGPLRFGFTTKHPLGMEVDSHNVEAVHNTAKLLESLGYAVEEVDFPCKKEDLTQTFIMMVFGETAAALRRMADDIGRPVRRSDVEATTWALGMLGKVYTAGDFAYARGKWNDLYRRNGAFHQKYDILITPTCATAPFEVGALQPTASEKRLLEMVGALNLTPLLKANVGPLADKTFAYIPFTPLANMTGQPSMSVPLHWTPDNLPVGVMFTAALGNDDILLRLASQLEEAWPWMDKVAHL